MMKTPYHQLLMLIILSVFQWIAVSGSAQDMASDSNSVTKTLAVSIPEGSQFAYNISVKSSPDEAAGINLLAVSQPEPNKDYLSLKIENISIERLVYQITDSKERLVDIKKIISADEAIPVGNYYPDMYFIEVINFNKVIKTFRVVKIDNRAL